MNLSSLSAPTLTGLLRRWWRPQYVAAALVLTVTGGLATQARADDEMFDFEVLQYKAKMLAAKPYEVRPVRVPEHLLAPAFTYDQHRDIRFRPEMAWWRREKLPFQLQFFHPGFIYNKTVQLSEVEGRAATSIEFNKRLFDYGKNELKGGVPSDMGFSGFRVHYALNNPNYLDELVVFQGASYFRALCAKAVYGLSARGLAIDTAEPTGEEFPIFEDFWIEKPAADAKSLTAYALLDSPSVAGAYRFIITPGDDTVVQVKLALYLRKPVKVLGVAPLTSMFWHGEGSTDHYGDFRPEVHDSDGLLVAHGSGEWLWRPLTNPTVIRSAAFADVNPRGFGLLQRDRDFAHYEDLEASYQKRPSTWVEPIGNWGRGAIRLIEIPTPDETNDNIVAFWQPETLPAVGDPLVLEYRLHWNLDQIKPPSGYTIATRIGHSKTHEPELTRFVVDFDSPYLHVRGSDFPAEAVVSVGEGAKLEHQSIQKNTVNGSWRVAFALRPDGSGRPVELRCFIRRSPHILTETWSYRWNP